MRAMACGGAPLSPQSHDMVRSCIGATVQQGYGLTETNASATLMDGTEREIGGGGGGSQGRQGLAEGRTGGGGRMRWSQTDGSE